MGNLTRLIVLKSKDTNRNVNYMNETKDVRGRLNCEEESVFSPFSKIEVEPSKSNEDHVHLRFCHSNKYWGQSPTDDSIVASSDKPVEDISNPSCTLFHPSFRYGNENIIFTHLHSGWYVRVDGAKSGPMKSRLYVDPNFHSYFSFVDWNTLVKLPKHLTFKGDNGFYLQGVWYEGDNPYLQFSGGDYNHEYVAYEVFLHPDGHVRIKSLLFGKFWRRSPNWIWADSSDAIGEDIDTLFWPVKSDDRTISLRNAGNNAFCVRLTADGKESCLNAGNNNIVKEAKLVLEELVLERSIYNVRYRMEDARIYDEEPFVAGTGGATNNSNTESTLSVKVSYVDTRSHSFTYTLSVMLGVKTTIETGIPCIADGKIEVSATMTNTFAWGETTTTSKTSEATYTVKVPPMSRVNVNYVATKGKCNVPFSYFQRDKKSNDGTFEISQHVDGIFNGVNYYSFRFEQLPFEPI